MLIVNPTIISHINNLRVAMYGRLQQLRATILPSNELSASIKLYMLIDENIRYDLVSLQTEDVSLDYFGFIALRRNIRNSIEAFYDLANLLFRKGYYDLLSYYEEKRSGNIYSDHFKGLVKELRDAGLEKYLKYDHLNISAKGHLAMEFRDKNQDTNVWDGLRRIIRESNNIVHPNIFTLPLAQVEREGVLVDLLSSECNLLCWSYEVILRQFGFQDNSEYQGFNPVVANDAIIKEIRTTPILLFTNGYK